MFLFNLGCLTDTNNSLRENLLKFRNTDPSKHEIDILNEKWHSGMDAIQQIQKIQMTFNEKKLNENE